MTDQEVPSIFRYRGRHRQRTEESGQTRSFDDSALPRVLSDTLAASAVGFIDDPMSFPWSSVNLDDAPVLVVDATRCSTEEATALLPALSSLTQADAVLSPAESTAINFANELGTGTTSPQMSEWNPLTETRRLIVHERRILKRIEREVGSNAIIHTIELATLTASPGGFGAHLAQLASASNARPVGVWGVRSRPGAPLHHGIAVLAAEPDR